MASGFLVFLLGLSWGGTVHPWKSAGPISAIVVGFIVMVLFTLLEVYVPLKKPLTPLRLFKDGRWVVAWLLLGLGAGVYYVFAINWPMQVAVFYNDGSFTYLGDVSSLVGIGIIAAQICGGLAHGSNDRQDQAPVHGRLDHRRSFRGE